MTKKVAKKKTKKPLKKKPTKTSKKISILDRIRSSKKQLQKARQKVSSEGEKLFKEAVRQLFKEFKGLEKFSWPEYTPHWNDGDTCEFGVHFDQLSVNEEVDKGNSDDLWYLEHAYKLLSKKEKEEARIVVELSSVKKDSWEASQLRSDLEIIRTRKLEEIREKYEMKKAITELLGDLDDLVYESMFGEGLVIVTRDGVTVGSYEHD